MQLNIYIDPATIPSLCFFTDLLNKNYKPEESISILGLSRYSLSDEVLATLGKGNIYFQQVQDYNLDNLLDLIIEKTQNKAFSDITFHINLLHFNGIIYQLAPYILTHDSNKVKFKIYSDGAHELSFYNEVIESKGFLDQESTDTNIIVEYLIKNKSFLNAFSVARKYNKSLKFLRYLITGRKYKILQLSFLQLNVIAWNDFFDCEYYFLNSNMFPQKALKDTQLKINNIKLVDSIQKMTEGQLDLLYQMLTLPTSSINFLNWLKTEQPTITVVIGTANFDKSDYILEKLFEIIDNTLSKNINNLENNTLYFKGHPEALAINSAVKKKYPSIQFIHDKIPIELLHILNKNIIFTGFFSSGYLSIKNTSIDKVYIKEQSSIMNFLISNPALSEKLELY